MKTSESNARRALQESMRRDGHLLHSRQVNAEEGAKMKERNDEIQSDSDDRNRSRIRFDRTINLGNVLTMVAMVVIVMTSWSMQDKRLAVLEEARMSQREKDQAQDADRREKFGEVRDALQDLRRSVEKLADRGGAR
jgi:hypothetical protein